MKKIKFMVMIFIMVGIVFTSFGLVYGDNNAYAYEVESSVKINDSYLYADTAHILVGDTVFVVGRYLVEALGGSIEWFEDTRTVRMTLNDKVIDIAIDSIEGKVDDVDVELYKAPFIKDGRTMIPLRFVSENFDCQVSWNQSTYTVDIISENLEISSEYTYERDYSDDDLYLLSKIVTVESGDNSLEMAMAIANTILNRVKSENFPDTIGGVIYQVDVHTQFPPAHKESFKTLEPMYLSIAAAKKALEGVNNIGESLYFNNQPFDSKADDLINIIDGEYFYK